MSLTPEWRVQNTKSEREVARGPDQGPRPYGMGWFGGGETPPPWVGEMEGAGLALPLQGRVREGACPAFVGLQTGRSGLEALFREDVWPEHEKARRLAPPGYPAPDQNGMSSSSMNLPSSFWVCLALFRKSTVSAMISQP